MGAPYNSFYNNPYASQWQNQTEKQRIQGEINELVEKARKAQEKATQYSTLATSIGEVLTELGKASSNIDSAIDLYKYNIKFDGENPDLKGLETNSEKIQSMVTQLGSAQTNSEALATSFRAKGNGYADQIGTLQAKLNRLP